MTKLLFRREAEADLRAIIAYYEEIAPGAVANILSDIYRSADLLMQFPLLGTPVPERNYRRIVTIKYHFKLVYEAMDDRIVILGIFRHQNRDL